MNTCPDCGIQFEPTKQNKIRCKACTIAHMKQKQRETFLRKYGATSPMKCADVKNKVSNTIREKYGVPWYVQSKQYQSANPRGRWANNGQFKKILTDLGLQTEEEFVIQNKRYDIHVINTNILIDINPTYTHNEVGNHWNHEPLPKDYHIEKSIVAEHSGYICIHVFDWDNRYELGSRIKEYETPLSNLNIEQCDGGVTITDNIGELAQGRVYEEGCIVWITQPLSTRNLQIIQQYVEYKMGTKITIGLDRNKNPNLLQYPQFNIPGKTRWCNIQGGHDFCADKNCIALFLNTTSEQVTISNLLSKEFVPVRDCGYQIIVQQCPLPKLGDNSIQTDYTYEEIYTKFLKRTNKIKNCEFCGKEFVANSNRQRYCKGPHYRTCPVCGRTYIEDNVENLKKPPVACSYECRVKKSQKTNLKKYGTLVPYNSGLTKPRDPCAKKEPKVKRPYLASRIIIQPNDLTLKLFHFLRSYHIKYEEAYSIDGYTYSCLLPDLNIVLVCSGPEFGEDKSIHRTYTDVANRAGFRCIHIYSFNNIGLIVQSLCPKIEVNLNDCTLYKLYPAVGETFLNRWHIQGSRRGQKLIVGIAKGQTILQAMSFCSSRNPNYYVELARFCTIPGVSVPGGYDKMLEFATEGMGLCRIISYCGIDHADIQDYKDMSLSYRRQTQVQKIWIKENSFVKQVVQNYNRWTDEEMISKGYYLDYDCGQYIFEHE